MELVTGIEDNLKGLASTCVGKRVGVYPAAYGRFASDLARRLDGFDVAGLYRPNPAVNDQGLPVFARLEEFLDTVDTVLLWGFDEAAADVFYRTLARSRHPEFINVLDPSHSHGLLRLRQPLRFADFHESRPEDTELLRTESLDEEALRRAFYRDDDMEREFARKVGITGRTNRFDCVLAAVEATMLECGVAFCPCPHCGRTVVSDQAFLLRQPELHFITAHRFVCHGEFYLFKTLPITIGMYLPGRELFINARPRAESMRYMFFEDHQIAAVIQRFKLQCLRRMETSTRYAGGGPKGNWPCSVIITIWAIRCATSWRAFKAFWTGGCLRCSNTCS